MSVNLCLTGRNGAYKHTIIDDDDITKVLQFTTKWHLRSDGYVASKHNALGLHRFIMDAKKGEEVDHINRDKLDNRKSNLRITTRQIQGRNSMKPTKTSKYPGVSKRGNKWKATIRNNTKVKHLGYYFIEEAAAVAYKKEALKLDPRLWFEEWNKL